MKNKKTPGCRALERLLKQYPEFKNLPADEIYDLTRSPIFQGLVFEETFKDFIKVIVKELKIKKLINKINEKLAKS
jgi:hypothetical protein